MAVHHVCCSVIDEYDGWLREHAWMHPDVILMSNLPEGNGLFTKTPLKHNTTILRVPISLQLTVESSKELLGSLGSLENLSDVEILSLRLLWEDCAVENSLYRPYLNTLPSETPPLLFTFSNQELDLVDDVTLKQFGQQMRSRVHDIWNRFEERLMALNSTCMSLTSLERLFAVASSHSMHIDGTTRIVPMADAINHKVNPPNYHVFSDYHILDEDDTIYVQTDRVIGSNEQIYEEYDRMDNSLHLAFFGFVSVDNPYHCVMLSLFPHVDDAHLVQLATTKWNGFACVRKDRSYMNDEMIDRFLGSFNNPSKREVRWSSNACLVDKVLPVSLTAPAAKMSLKTRTPIPPSEPGMTRRQTLALDFRIEEIKVLKHLRRQRGGDEL